MKKKLKECKLEKLRIIDEASESWKMSYDELMCKIPMKHKKPDNALKFQWILNFGEPWQCFDPFSKLYLRFHFFAAIQIEEWWCYDIHSIRIRKKKEISNWSKSETLRRNDNKYTFQYSSVIKFLGRLAIFIEHHVYPKGSKKKEAQCVRKHFLFCCRFHFDFGCCHGNFKMIWFLQSYIIRVLVLRVFG